MKKTTSGPAAAEWDKIGADLAAEYAANPESAQEGDSTPADWPLDMHVALIAKDHGLDAVRAFIQHFVIPTATTEELEDAARELRKRRLGRVADVLLGFAKNLPSEVEAEIKKGHEEWLEHQPPHYPHPWPDRRDWYVTEWLRRRMKISGESWNTLVRKHDLEEWAKLIEPDVLCQDGRWLAVGPNGRLMDASKVPNALFITRKPASPTRQ